MNKCINKKLFKKYLAQISTNSLQLEILRAEGNYIYDVNNKNIWT